MSVTAIFLLVVIGVLIAVVAIFMIRIIVLLRMIDDTLGKVIFGVRAIAHRTEPIKSLTSSMETDLGIIGEALAGLVEKASQSVQG